MGLVKKPSNKALGMNINFGAGTKKVKGYLSADKNPNLKPDIIIDLNKIPYKKFKDESVDNALFDNVLEHLWVELPAFTQEMRRILKPNGKVKITVPNCFFWKHRLAFLGGKFRDKDGWHINHSFLLKPSELKRFFELNDFEVKFEKPESIWSNLAWLSQNLFLQDIRMVARKRP